MAKVATKQTVKHVTSSAAALAANPPAKLAATSTSNPKPRGQKLAYASDETKLAVVASAAKGSQQKLNLAVLQDIFGKAKTMQADAVLTALQSGDHANPRRIYRRSIRAGILVTQ